MSNVSDILKTINDAIDKLGGVASAKQQPLFKEIVNMLQKLEVKNNAILNNINNLKLINQIKVKIERLIVDDRYKTQLKSFVSAYNDVSDLQNEYFSQFAAFKGPTKTLEIFTKSAIETTINNLTETGLQAGVTDGMRTIMQRNMQQGTSMSDLIDQLRGYMLNSNDNDGALLKYVKGYATTAINQYSAEYNKQISDDLGLEWYLYVGSLLTTSRPFCVHAVHEKYIHASEFPALLMGHFRDGSKVAVNRKTGLPQGMMDGTNVDNFPRRRGGYSCGHQLVAVDETIVPQNIRDDIYSSTAYHAWALKNGKEIKQATTIGSVMKRAKESAKEVQSTGENIAKKYNGNVTPINFKSEESIFRKVNGELGGDITQLKDAVRNTVVVKYDDLDKVVNDLKNDSRFLRVKVQDGSAYFGYKGVITNIKTENGIVGEMQVNSPGMIYAKEPKNIALNYMDEDTYNEIAQKTGLEGGLGHKFYEEIRQIDLKTASQEQIDRYNELISESEKYYKNFYGF